MIEQLFFELIRVAIGTQVTLSRPPSACEWKELYNMAKKQSLVGICFAGLQKLYNSVNQEPRTQNPQPNSTQNQEPITQNLDEVQYLTWMGMAAKIQQRNEVVNRQCVELQKRLSKEGLRSCILKGQAVAYLYDENLSGLRQSGDIDAWLDASRNDIMRYVQNIAPTTNVREHHMELEAFQDTEVEIHFWPGVIRHFIKNRKLQKWFERKRDEVFSNRIELYGSVGLAICAPTPEFHAVQQMAHMYHHLFDSGIGLRQVMDYYFVLQALCNDNTSTGSAQAHNDNLSSLNQAINHIGMGRFAAAMMWVLQETMGLEREKMICEPSEEDGKFLLGEIVRGGNFGKYDDKKTRDTSNYFSSFYGSIFRNMRYLRFNPFDWFWSPIWRLYYFGWRKMNGYH